MKTSLGKPHPFHNHTIGSSLIYPRPAIPGVKLESDKWIVEDKWEIEDPLFRAALNLQPRYYLCSLVSSNF